MAVAVVWVGFGAHALLTGRVEGVGNWSSRRVRALAIAVMLVGAGVGAVGFLVDADGDGGTTSGWSDWVLLGIWLAFLAGIVGYNVRRRRRAARLPGAGL